MSAAGATARLAVPIGTEPFQSGAPEATQLTASFVTQLSVLEPPAPTSSGSALRITVGGGSPGDDTTVTATLSFAEPPAPVHVIE